MRPEPIPSAALGSSPRSRSIARALRGGSLRWRAFFPFIFWHFSRFFKCFFWGEILGRSRVSVVPVPPPDGGRMWVVGARLTARVCRFRFRWCFIAGFSVADHQGLVRVLETGNFGFRAVCLYHSRLLLALSGGFPLVRASSVDLVSVRRREMFGFLFLFPPFDLFLLFLCLFCGLEIFGTSACAYQIWSWKKTCVVNCSV